MTKRTRTRRWLWTLGTIVVLAVLIWAVSNYLYREMIRAELPETPEMARYPDAVQKQILEADAEARRHPQSGGAVGGLAIAYHANNMFDYARVAYGIAMRVDKKDPRFPYLLGVLETTTGENERAITYLTRAVELDPDYPQAWTRLGEILFRREAYEEAERALRRALEIDPTHPHAGVTMARVLGLRDEWEQAANVLEPCVRAHPVYGPGHRMLALVYQELGRTVDQKQHEDLGSDVGLQMDDPRVHDLYALSSTASVLVTQGQIARTWGEYDRALKLFQRAVQVAPRDKDARLALGRFLGSPGISNPVALQEARNHLEIGLALDSTYVNTRHDYAMILQSLGDTVAAAAQWERILREEPDHAMAWMSLGELRFFRGDYEGALLYYKRGLAVLPDTPFSLGSPGFGNYRLAQTCWRLGRDRETFDAFERSAKIDPLAVDTYIEWARFLKEKGRAETGVAVYLRGVDAIPDDPTLRLGFGNYLLQIGRFGEARGQLTESLRLKPGDVRALSALGYVALELGENDEAIRHLETALQINPDFPLAHYHLGNALLRKGRKQEAIEQFEAALRLQPGFAPARRGLEELRGKETAPPQPGRGEPGRP